MYFLRSSIFILVAEFVIGLGLVINCARGLVTREWMYDPSSSNIMFVSQIVGIGIGLMLMALATGLLDIPFLFFGYGE